MPTGAERYRSSVGGALELSGTGARSGWSADVRCEHPVGGPCVSGPMKVRHADRRSAGQQVGVHSSGPNQYCPGHSFGKHGSQQGAHRAFLVPQLGGRACRTAPQSRHAVLGGPPDRSSVTTRRAVCAQIRLKKRRTVHRWPARAKSGGLVERAGYASRGVQRALGDATSTRDSMHVGRGQVGLPLPPSPQLHPVRD